MSSKKNLDPRGSEEIILNGNNKIPGEKNGVSPTCPTVKDAMSNSNMASCGAEQGKKRTLSLSPQLPKYSGKVNPKMPESPISPTPIQQTKKRFISKHISDFFNIEPKTGNDLSRGQDQTGNEPKGKLSRAESNMAAPMSNVNTTSTEHFGQVEMVQTLSKTPIHPLSPLSAEPERNKVSDTDAQINNLIQIDVTADVIATNASTQINNLIQTDVSDDVVISVSPMKECNKNISSVPEKQRLPLRAPPSLPRLSVVLGN